jgi:hypothetical protein
MGAADFACCRSDGLGASGENQRIHQNDQRPWMEGPEALMLRLFQSLLWSWPPPHG